MFNKILETLKRVMGGSTDATTGAKVPNYARETIESPTANAEYLPDYDEKAEKALRDAGDAATATTDMIGEAAETIGIPTELIEKLKEYITANDGTLNLPEGLIPTEVEQALQNAISDGQLDFSKLSTNLLNDEVIQKLTKFLDGGKAGSDPETPE